jgi:UTP--glucose-1-phosphate uridylyltransferase
MRIRKAVFPVAGLGTRFLPATKAMPKEMLPVVDKPLIQYAVEEALAAGAEVLIFVTGRTKRAIEDHFDRAYELETELELKKRVTELKALQDIVPRGVSCVYLRQAEALGLGHAVLCAEKVVDEEPFFVALPDDLIVAPEGGCLAQLRARHEALGGGSVLAVQKVPREETRRYGVIAPEAAGPGLHRIRHMVEKPAPADAPSELAVVGRYLLTPRIFAELARTERGAGGEIQLTDGIQRLLASEPVHAHEYRGTRYDCGSKLGFLQATVDLGLAHDDLAPAFRAWLGERFGAGRGGD